MQPEPAKRANALRPSFARNLYTSLTHTAPQSSAEKQSCLGRNILIINGHPDPRPERFCAALCDAYEAGAKSGAWETRRLNLGALALDEPASNAPSTMAAVEMVRRSNRLVIVFPLWLDQPPEQLRILFDEIAGSDCGERMARIVVTMEMPAFAHRATFQRAGNPSAQTMDLPGIKTDNPVFIGCVGTISASQREHWLQSIRTLGIKGL